MKGTHAFAVAALTCAASATAFEVDTHARMTMNAWALLLAERPTIVSDLGIARGYLLTDPKNLIYYDASAGTAFARYMYIWEAAKMYGEDANGNAVVTEIRGDPMQWMMQGAVREDDSQGEPNPQDDPFLETSLNQQYRVLNHFLDPVNRLPLHVGIDLGLRADDWAIGRIPGQTDTSDPSRTNHFSVYDAREAMYRALTGLDRAANPVAATELERNRWWATMFRALGDVVHLIQDMGQPQHTRNDPHSGVACPGNPNPLPLLPCLGGHKSVFEQYMNNRALVGPASTHIVCTIGPPPADYAGLAVPLPYFGYPVPRIDDYGSFFTAGGGDGLADYTNRGFFSAGTNIGSNAYTTPSNTASDYTRNLQAYPLPCALVDSKLTLLMGDVPDARGPTATNVALSAEGIFTAFTFIGPKYVLVRANYDDMAALVIPRAVSYSAALLTYFFRGTLEINPPDIGIFSVADQSAPTGFTKLKLKVKNTDSRNESMSGGSVVAVIRYRVNSCYGDDLHGEYGSPDIQFPLTCRKDEEQVVVSKSMPLSLAKDEEQEFDFDFSGNPLPFSATDLYLQAVYRGPLGQERDAVAVGTLDIPEPLFFALLNISDFLCVNGELAAFDGSGEKLTSQTATDYLKAQQSADKNGVVWSPLQPAPYEKVEIRFTKNGSDPAGTVASIDLLPQQRFSRIAVLTNHFDPAQMTFAVDNLCGLGAQCGGEYATSFKGPRNQVDYDGGVFNIEKLDPWRGVYAYGYFGIYKNVDSDCQSLSGTFQWPDFVDLNPVPVSVNF